MGGNTGPTKNPYALHLAKHSTHGVILGQLGKHQTILDVGCNDGYIGQLADSSNSFYGLDYRPESVSKAKLVYTDAAQYDLNELPKLPWKHKFNVIIFADVLEHVIEPEKVLRSFIEHYSADGSRVIISLPNIANWAIRLQLFRGKFDATDTGIMDRTHLHFYTFRSGKELAVAGGLRPVKCIGGASWLGRVIQVLPFLRNVLATGIIIVAEPQN